MTNISIPNFVAMEQIYKCYNVLETQFVCLFDTIMLTLQWIPPNNQNKNWAFCFQMTEMAIHSNVAVLRKTPLCNTPGGPPNIFRWISKNSPGSTDFTPERLEKRARAWWIAHTIFQAAN